MFQLQAGTLVGAIESRLGGRISGLRPGALPVLRSTPSAQLPPTRQDGGDAPVPFSSVQMAICVENLA